jgi:hypothetical protein
MTSVSRTGPFEVSGHAVARANIQIGECVQLPALSIEIAGQNAAPIILEKRIDADRFCAGEMIQNNLIGKGNVLPRFFLLYRIPLVLTGRGIPRLPRITAFPALGINVVAPPKKVSE